jgi:hypothetical protein
VDRTSACPVPVVGRCVIMLESRHFSQFKSWELRVILGLLGLRIYGAVIPATKLEQLKKVWNHLVHGVRKRDLLLKMARIWRGEPGKVNVGNTQISMLCRPGVHAYFSGL